MCFGAGLNLPDKGGPQRCFSSHLCQILPSRLHLKGPTCPFFICHEALQRVMPRDLNISLCLKQGGNSLWGKRRKHVGQSMVPEESMAVGG